MAYISRTRNQRTARPPILLLPSELILLIIDLVSTRCQDIHALLLTCKDLHQHCVSAEYLYRFPVAHGNRRAVMLVQRLWERPELRGRVRELGFRLGDGRCHPDEQESNRALELLRSMQMPHLPSCTKLLVEPWLPAAPSSGDSSSPADLPVDFWWIIHKAHSLPLLSSLTVSHLSQIGQIRDYLKPADAKAFPRTLNTLVLLNTRLPHLHSRGLWTACHWWVRRLELVDPQVDLMKGCEILKYLVEVKLKVVEGGVGGHDHKGFWHDLSQAPRLDGLTVGEPHKWLFSTRLLLTKLRVLAIRFKASLTLDAIYVLNSAITGLQLQYQEVKLEKVVLLQTRTRTRRGDAVGHGWPAGGGLIYHGDDEDLLRWRLGELSETCRRNGILLQVGTCHEER
jgi:hypothetical protein